MKTMAWIDRRAARDLYDLAGLATLGALTTKVATLVHRATGWRVDRHTLDAVPAGDWDIQLAHQTRTTPTTRQCLDSVLRAYDPDPVKRRRR
jgi:hypothetical protein